jgi:outer membrane protein
MTKGVLIFNSILLLLIAVLFYLHFSSQKSNGASGSGPMVKSSLSGDSVISDFRIAYFDLDSVTNSFSMIKDVKSELSREEERMSSELARLEKGMREKINGYKEQAKSGMTPVQSELANQDVMQMQTTMEDKRAELDQRYRNLYMQRMQDVKSKIEQYLKDYNKSKGYSYIFGYEPGFIYYRDSMYNITSDLIKGLNGLYIKKK